MIYVVISISLIAVIFSLIGIVMSIRFQKKQKEKYSHLEELISENKDLTFSIKNGFSEEEVSKIDPNIDVNALMSNLYQIYLDFLNRTNNLDLYYDDILTKEYKEIYINKVNNYKRNGYKDLIENINLVGYSINKFTENKIEFRINIECNSYKTLNGSIVSGSTSYKVQHIDLVTYKKENGKWLISNCNAIYEKKLSN